MSKKIFVIDLDGTLLNTSKGISPANAAAIKTAQSNSQRVILASGRPHQLIVPFARQLGLTDKIICCNGAYTLDLGNNQISPRKVLSKQDLKEVYTNCLELGLECTTYAGEYIYSVKETRHVAGLRAHGEAIGAGLKVKIIPDWDEMHSQIDVAHKVLVPGSENGALTELYNRLLPKFEAERSEDNKLDVTARGASKGLALNTLLAESGDEDATVIAFGDADNDKSNFERASISVAMGNGSEALKSIADHVLEDNDTDLLGEFILKSLQHA